MDLLIVIDLQKAFINKNTFHLESKIESLLNENKYKNVIFTRFVNTEDSIFVNKLNYRECITEDSKQIVINTGNDFVIDKNGYSVLTNQLKEYIDVNNINNIYLCGIDTECCVLKSALDLFEAGYNVYVLKDYCASFYGVIRHENALEILKSNIGKNYVI